MTLAERCQLIRAAEQVEDRRSWGDTALVLYVRKCRHCGHGLRSDNQTGLCRKCWHPCRLVPPEQGVLL